MEHTTTVPVFTLGDRLRKAREVGGLTQSDLASSLGIGRRSVSRYEDGEQVPKRGVVMAWAMATGVPFGWLWTGELGEGGNIRPVTARYPSTPRSLARAA